jgi:His-Xaa-Ser system radical SAM maturase HxsB
MEYRFLPFRFDRLNSGEIFLSNEVGEFTFISNDDFKKLVNKELPPDSETFLNLKAKQILTNTDVDTVIEMLATKYRTKKNFLNSFTALHMVVITLRCNSNCSYCQVSKKDLTDINFDLDKSTAKKIVEEIFESPSPKIKIEFQGGEPLLNFEIIKYIIELAELKNVFKKKKLEFVICTNLTLMEEKMLKFLKGHRVYISTSIDGPKDLHIKNRPLQEIENSFDIVIEKIKLCREYLGNDSVSALMTATSYSIGRFKEIIDTYIALGFHSIFLRALNPYGFAKRDKHILAYPVDTFVENYKTGLQYIIDLNLKGSFFIEEYANILLTRILTPFGTGYMDLQSPAGIVINGVIYNYNGNVYVSDEGRMLAAMGDDKFLMGNVKTNTYQEIFNSDFIHSIIENACLESLPECSYCAYQSYCGADPVRNYSEQGDIVGHRPTSDACKRNKEIFKYLFELIKQDDPKINSVLWSWINRKPLNLNKHDKI